MTDAASAANEAATIDGISNHARSKFVASIRASIKASGTTFARPRLLFISHAWGGGVEQHVQDLISLCRERADILLLRGFLNDGVELAWHTVDGSTTTVRVGGFADVHVDQWVDALHALGLTRIHVHHIHGWPRAILALIDRLDLPIDVTLHDYYAVCPQYNLAREDGTYCGEPDVAACNACIAKRPHTWNTNILEWRETMLAFVKRAQRVIVPSHDLAIRLTRYLPDCETLVWPHPEPASLAPPRIVKIALIGALSPIKGLQVATLVAQQARVSAPQLTFRLIGHAAEPLPREIVATGSYNACELPRLIADERPDVLWFPSQVPETYSFALSAAIASGLPIVASAFGAFAERLAKHPNATLRPYNATAEVWIDALARGTQRERETLAASTSQNAQYAQRYLDAVAAPCGAIDTAPLGELLRQSPSAPSEPDRPIYHVFEVGRRGGHTQSLDLVGARLKALAPHESQVAGREELLAYINETNRLHNELDTTEAAHARLANALSEQHDENARLQSMLVYQTAELAHAKREFDRIVSSRSWQLTRPLRIATRVVRALRHDPHLIWQAFRDVHRVGLRTAAHRFYANTSSLGTTQQPNALALERAPIRIVALKLATSDAPTLSIVIPVYAQHETTFECLRSIAAHPPHVPFEIIVMDDTSPVAAADALSVVEGVRFVRNDSNLGFIGNVNAGARVARGEFLLILNNDTVLTKNAIDAMHATFATHERVGLVGAKLLNADGSLQEAGGIVWRDGSAWNWGRSKDALDPTYNFVRDADYCSGAALMIRRELFAEMNGFDTHYTPAYYEDTDLAFRVRERGLRVLYQPHASIYHLEGVSHGRDASAGIKAYQTTNAKKFFERWRTTLETHRENGQAPALEAHRGTRLSILIVEAFLITPDQDSGSLRLLNLMKILRNERHHVVFIAENLDGTPRYRNVLESFGIEVLHGHWAQNVRSVLRERGSEFDAIVMCRHYVASEYLLAARRYAPKAKIVFDTVDLHFLREEREAKLSGSAEAFAASQATRVKELGVCKAADVTFVVSEIEADLLRKSVPGIDVRIVSNIHEPESSVNGFSERNGVLFVGGFRHPPNIDAVQWYAQKVLPHLRRLAPGLVTRIVGSNMPDEISALHCEDLQIVGYVADLKPILRSTRVSIAPLRYGAGVKGKINEAMNFGIPVVATSMAVEGMHLTSGTHCLVADDEEAFAKSIVELNSNEALWQMIVNAARESVVKHFSFASARNTLRDVLDPKKS